MSHWKKFARRSVKEMTLSAWLEMNWQPVKDMGKLFPSLKLGAVWATSWTMTMLWKSRIDWLTSHWTLAFRKIVWGAPFVMMWIVLGWGL